MFKKFGVPAVQVGVAFELPKEDEKIELAPTLVEKKENEDDVQEIR